MNNVLLKLPQISIRLSWLILVCSIAIFTLASFLKPAHKFSMRESNFKKNIPAVIGDWYEAEQLTPQVSLVSDERSLINQLYDDTLMRTYVDQRGHQVMLALAYAKEQRQDIKVHQPDVCYPAQGFALMQSKEVRFSLIGHGVPIIGKQQLYSGQNHLEAVSYWIRVGDETMTSGLQMRLKIIKDGLLKNRLDDGVLVRVSSIISDESKLSEAFALHQHFLKEFVTRIEATNPQLLVP